MRAISVSMAFFLAAAATVAAERSVLFDVREADSREIAAIELILADAARIAALEDRSAVVSDINSIAWYASRVVPINIAARSSSGAVQIRVSWSSPVNSVVSETKTLKQFEVIDAFIGKNLAARFAARAVRKVGSPRKPNQTPEPTPTAVTTPADAGLAPAAVVAHL